MPINDLILVQKTHLDIGFTDLPSVVIRQYCDFFIPAAIELAEKLDKDEEIRFIWTTGSWLIHTALEQGSHHQRQKLEQAIEAGWIRWHALPFTTHTELADPTLLRAGLALSQQLDARFGTRTQTAKMTDVPGHGIGLVPLLAEAGVRLLHIGVNPACRLPVVPPAFRWRHEDSEITVLYESGYGHARPIPGSNAGLAFLHTNDNLGPPTPSAIRAEVRALQARHPEARIHAGSMEDALAVLDPSELPVIESEIGDSWLHGVGSAPQRVADLLAIRRGLAELPPSSSKDEAARSALMMAEHTWGLDCKKYLPSHETWSPTVFAHERRQQCWRPLEQAYAEQDAYVDEALKLGPDSLTEAVDESRKRRCLPRPTASAEVCERWLPIVTPRWIMRFDPANGTVTELYDRHLKIDLCEGAPGGRLGILRYQVLGSERFRGWVENYLLPDEELWWAAGDFDGPNQNQTFPRDLILPTRADEMWTAKIDGGTEWIVHHRFRHPRQGEAGVPPVIGVRWFLPDSQDQSITIDIGWDDKPASLVREALWFGWRQGGEHQPQQILLDKLGVTVDASKVVDDGGLLHATDAVTLCGQKSTTRLVGLDSPLVCPDGPRILERRQGPLNLERGLWWNLLNTAWSTNFSMWTEGPMGYRFTVEVNHD